MLSVSEENFYIHDKAEELLSLILPYRKMNEKELIIIKEIIKGIKTIEYELTTDYIVSRYGIIPFGKYKDLVRDIEHEYFELEQKITAYIKSQKINALKEHCEFFQEEIVSQMFRYHDWIMKLFSFSK